ncbi:hypothetical protein ABZY44_16195 [Streptomyces sp. NPDC006544]|uniref:hypothetical protein n=1 Tax=Streptomyces sp. NPDC006544 TaxID=3154583 RepID=UPI0033A537DB
MTRPAPLTERAAVRWSRLLLLAGLLLGIVTMHTLGHPTQAHAMQDVPAVHFVPPAELPGHHAPGAVADLAAGFGADRTAGLAADLAPGSVPDVALTGAPGPRTGMDPMSVCLAVLGALVLLFLGAALAGPDRATPLGGAARAPGRSGGPEPPPPRELLTLLAVRRV